MRGGRGDVIQRGGGRLPCGYPEKLAAVLADCVTEGTRFTYTTYTNFGREGCAGGVGGLGRSDGWREPVP